MKKIYSLLKKNKKYSLAALLVIVLVLIVVIKKSNSQATTFIVAKTNVVQSVVLSGKVDTIDRADLGFAVPGRIANIFVKNNQKVTQGDILAQLEIGELLADLKIKQLNSNTSDVSVKSAKENLEKVTLQENTKVDSAYRKLLSEGLSLTPDDFKYGVSAPVVTGIYNGIEGEYKISIDKKSVTDTDFRLLTFGLERETRILSKEGPTVLGTKGLYISFPINSLENYKDTTWYLDIPNKASSVYLANYNAYNEAKHGRDLAIKNAQAKYDELLSSDGGGNSVAQAEIEKIRAEIKKNTISAPFTGSVTNIEKEIGETVSIGDPIISILGEGKLEVVLQVSELDVSKLVPGANIKIKLDAFPGEEFVGTLDTVNSRDKKVDGVPVYEAFVKLPSDSRIKTGMSAKGEIILASKDDVLAVPMYLVEKSGSSNFVEVLNPDGKIVKKEITLGLVGTDNMAEVQNGLSEGDKVVSPKFTK